MKSTTTAKKLYFVHVYENGETRRVAKTSVKAEALLIKKQVLAETPEAIVTIGVTR